ncbi:hypothetical protein EJB05_37687, partial [Eragrostis curvula]
MVWYVLNNCPEIEPYIKKVREDLQTKYTSNYHLDKALRKEFHGWFKKEIATIKYNRNQHVPHDLEALASQPLLRVKVYSECIIKDVRYQTIEVDKIIKTQNSGVVVSSFHDRRQVDFYGVIKDIIELQYNSTPEANRTVVLFWCDWFDKNEKNVVADAFFKSINTAKLWYKDQPYVLAQQVRKVFYLPCTLKGRDWKVVQHFEQRNLYNVRQQDDEPGSTESEIAYQDDYAEDGDWVVDEVLPDVQPDDTGVDKELITAPASMINELRKRTNTDSDEDSDDEVEDDTLYNYQSDVDASDDDNPHIPRGDAAAADDDDEDD